MTTPRTTSFELPIYIRGVAPLFDSSVNSMVDSVERIITTHINSLVTFETLDYDELYPIFEFFRISPLFTRIFTIERMRAVAQRGDELYRNRGKTHALSLFSDLMQVAYSWTFRRNAQGIPVGIVFVISPPTGISIHADWARYMRNAFRFLLPVRLELDEFIIGLSAEGNFYIESTAILSHDIP